MKRVVWNHEERAILFNEMVDLQIEHPDMVTKDVLARAQIRLPVNRRREVTYNMVFNYKYLVAKAGVLADKKRSDIEQEPVPPPGPVELSLSDMLEAVMQKFAVMVADEVVRRNPQGFHIQYPRAVAVEPEVVNEVPDKPKTPGVLIIGLNGQQVTIVKSRFPHRDLMFVTAEDAKSYAPIRRDNTILMTKFISHAVQSRYRQAPNLQYCNGGVTDLTAMISRIR